MVGLSKHINNYRQTKIIFFYFIFLFGGLIYFFVDYWKIYKKQKNNLFSILHHFGTILIILMSLVNEIYQENDEIRKNTYLVIFYLSRMVVLNTIVLYIVNKKLKAITLFFFLLFHIPGAIQCFTINWKNYNFMLNYYKISILLLIPENIITYYKIFNYK